MPQPLGLEAKGWYRLPRQEALPLVEAVPVLRWLLMVLMRDTNHSRTHRLEPHTPHTGHNQTAGSRQDTRCSATAEAMYQSAEEQAARLKAAFRAEVLPTW